ncbi:MAG: AbrB/MazE/SpoVT family DNA-binding domain-containing protein [Anaerolineae bacterium]|jgi:bifunctional DNA-binding transcriptional regulator/antitoxin component of YhaV-PrlF toxin-antitoxin module
MQTTFAVRLRERGQITLPQPVRDSLAVDTGDTLNLVQIDDILLLSPRQALIPKLSQEFTALMQEEGVSLAQLLQGLEDERKLTWQERYADNA